MKTGKRICALIRLLHQWRLEISRDSLRLVLVMAASYKWILVRENLFNNNISFYRVLQAIAQLFNFASWVGSHFYLQHKQAASVIFILCALHFPLKF